MLKSYFVFYTLTVICFSLFSQILLERTWDNGCGAQSKRGGGGGDYLIIQLLEGRARTLRIVLGWGYENGRVNSTRARVDGVASDH